MTTTYVIRFPNGTYWTENGSGLRRHATTFSGKETADWKALTLGGEVIPAHEAY